MTVYEVLSKARRGHVKVGHKYTDRKRTARGGWRYIYATPGGKIFATPATSSADRLRKLHERMGAKKPELMDRYKVTQHAVDPERPFESQHIPAELRNRKPPSAQALAEVRAMIQHAFANRPASLWAGTRPGDGRRDLKWPKLRVGDRVVGIARGESYRDTFEITEIRPAVPAKMQTRKDEQTGKEITEEIEPAQPWKVELQRVDTWRGDAKPGERGFAAFMTQIATKRPADLEDQVQILEDGRRSDYPQIDWYTQKEYDKFFPPPKPGKALSEDMNEIDLAEPYEELRSTPGDALRARQYLESLFKGISAPAMKSKKPARSALIMAARAMRAIDETLGGILPTKLINLQLNTPMKDAHTGAFYTPMFGQPTLVFDKYYESAVWHEWGHALDDYLGNIAKGNSGAFNGGFASDQEDEPMHMFAILANDMPSQALNRKLLANMPRPAGQEEGDDYYDKPREIVARFTEFWVRYRLRAKGWKGSMPISSVPQEYTEAEMRYLAPLFEATLKAYDVIAKSRGLADRGVLVVELRKAERGERVAGAKYQSRTWDAGAGRWRYRYRSASTHGPALRQALRRFESWARTQPIEHEAAFTPSGRLLFQVAGDETQVGGDWRQDKAARGAIVTHNHPREVTFSMDDIMSACVKGYREIRAVGPRLTYRLVLPEGAAWNEHTSGVFLRHYRELKPKYEAQVEAGRYTPDEAQTAIYHQTTMAAAEELGWRYMREFR